ncbi:formylglycine-generating enzyme family protein [Myxococcota bacterium]|nr:formylglycine-generating enzyme family protein [Myxococcota bacterium]
MSALEAQLRAAQGEREAARKRAEALEAARAALEAQLQGEAEKARAARAALEVQLQGEAEKARAAREALEAQLQGEAEKARAARAALEGQRALWGLKGEFNEHGDLEAIKASMLTELARLEAARRAPVASISEVGPRWRALPPEMVLIPAGLFLRKVRKGLKVTLSRPFLMMTTPVTQWQWRQVMGNNPSHFSDKPDSEQRPVENVGWFDVMAFCNALSKREGGMREAYQQVGDKWRRIDGADGYRLPTEAEWEYACRAGTKTAYWSGENEGDLARVGWYDENSDGQTHPVGEKNANPYGLFDMHGNVLEWVEDWYGDYPIGDVTDPKGPSKGSGRVMRGGSWYYGAFYARAANRLNALPSYRNRDLGFRLVRTPR